MSGQQADTPFFRHSPIRHLCARFAGNDLLWGISSSGQWGSSSEPWADNAGVMSHPRPGLIIKAWVWWGTLAGAAALVLAYLSALMFGAVGTLLQGSFGELPRSVLGALALPGFVMEGAVAGALLGGIVGLVALALHSLGLSRTQHRAVSQILSAGLFGMAATIVAGVFFDAGLALRGTTVAWIRWGWVLTFGLVIGLACYRTSTRPLDAYSMPETPHRTTDPAQ